jgi:hypothetical protein
MSFSSAVVESRFRHAHVIVHSLRSFPARGRFRRNASEPGKSSLSMKMPISWAIPVFHRPAVQLHACVVFLFREILSPWRVVSLLSYLQRIGPAAAW